ncbi:MAG: 16S rRNA (adenine(1518)-N(6)/adenine(1519)-N(6))-dimethyltransferase RsmA, partial [Myxococcota bacterium]|nr:16S rRNA (adenine(1518)-N(6)/adenine(1519)-N(6))-dimethyltransferase RsmA [Myxococcota bacterium]
MPDYQPVDPRYLKRLLGTGPKKSWGQNFLHDRNVLRQIVEVLLRRAESPAVVIEIAAGLGALTSELLNNDLKIWAVERDRDLVPIIRDHFSGADLKIIETDAARLDYAALATEAGGPLTVVGNLPYQISSRILVSMADAAPYVKRAVVMVQREVAKRMAAESGSKEYGLLSILLQRKFAVEKAFDVPPGSFFPPPRVTSAVVVLDRCPEAWSAEEDAALVEVARASFSQRRKKLRNSLKGGLGISAE